MPRLFTGLLIPPEVAQELSLRRGGIIGARWIDPEDYHVTLRIVGDVSEPFARDLDDELARVRRPPFSLTFECLDMFGGGKPRAAVARIRVDPALSLLQADLERACRNAGADPETRKFTPHVTLARLKSVSAAEAASYLQSRSPLGSMQFDVDRFALFSARASTGGGPYVVEAEYPLGAGHR